MLSFDQIKSCFPEGAEDYDVPGGLVVSAQWLHDFARAIEAAVLTEQAKQKPIAWRYELATIYADGTYQGWEKKLTVFLPTVPIESVRNIEPLYLYSAPAPEEMEALCVMCGQPTMHIGNCCYRCCQITAAEKGK